VSGGQHDSMSGNPGTGKRQPNRVRVGRGCMRRVWPPRGYGRACSQALEPAGLAREGANAVAGPSEAQEACLSGALTSPRWRPAASWPPGLALLPSWRVMGRVQTADAWPAAPPKVDKEAQGHGTPAELRQELPGCP
jgi:hypothetical protein